MKFVFWLLLLFPAFLKGQLLTGLVVDENNTPVAGAFLIGLPDSVTTSTSHNGSFSLPESDSVWVHHISYESRVFPVSKNVEYLRIQINSTSKKLEEITVSALTLKSDLLTYDGNSSYIPRKEIESSSPVIITDILNQEPGVYMHSGALNTNRITIRGVGARSPFSTNKIRAYYGEIPLTNGSGETTIEDIGLSSIGSLEIIKGPNSSTFGNGLGGVIHIKPRQPDAISNSRYLDIAAGSFGLLKTTTGLSLTSDNKGMRVELTRLISEGYRDNNELDRTSGFITANYFDKKNKYSLISYVIDQKAFIPSSINEEDFENNPTKAADNWSAARGFEDYITLFTGIEWDRIISEQLIFQTSIFGSYKDNYEPRPFNILEESTLAGGLRSKLSWDRSDLIKAVAGIEAFYDQNNWKTLENLYQMNSGRGSVEGEILTQFREHRGYFNFFVKNESRISDWLKASVGININQTQYRLIDRDNNPPDQSGDYNFNWIFSPRLGLNYRINEKIAIYGSVSHGFSPPTLEETLNPEGLINNTIKPEKGWMQEMGIRYQGEKMSASVTGYLMQISDLLVARRTTEDQYIGINAGKTSQNGLEFDLNYLILNQKNLKITANSNYTFQDFQFDKFIEDERDFSGNQLTGVPKNQFNATTRVEFWKGFHAQVSWQFIDNIPITDDNSVFADSYNLLNLNLGYTFEYHRWEFTTNYWIRNLTDEDYASMILVNAVGFGNSLPRYYYPGNPKNHLLRIQIVYNLHQ